MPLHLRRPWNRGAGSRPPPRRLSPLWPPGNKVLHFLATKLSKLRQMQVFFMCCVSYVSYVSYVWHVWYVWMVLILCNILKPLNIPLFQPLSATLAAPSRPWQRDRRRWAPWRKPPSAATRVPEQPRLWIPYHAYIYIYTKYIYIYIYVGPWVGLYLCCKEIMPWNYL